MSKIVLLAAAFLASSLPVAAQTIVPGGTIATQTWSTAGSPYIVQGDLHIPTGNTLTIQAGTIVRFPSGDTQASGLDPTRVEIVVDGILDVQGSGPGSVVFEAQTGTSPGTWYGIRVTATPSASATLTGATIRHAVYGVQNAALGVPVIARQCRFTANSAAGLRIDAGNVDIERSTIDANPVGIDVTGAGSGGYGNLMIHSNATCGIRFTTTGTATPSLVNCTIHANGATGVELSATVSSSLTFMLKNCIVSGHTTGLASLPGGGSLTLLIDFSNFWNNTTHVTGTVSGGSGYYLLDPQYVAAPVDLHLLPTSPMIDAGTAAGAPTDDFDGDARPQTITMARWDIGADEVVPSVAPPPSGSATKAPRGGGGGCGLLGIEALLFVVLRLRRRVHG
jgi:hypothetical protein